MLKAPTELVTGAIESVAKLPVPVLDSDPMGSPTELYTRVARGVTNCWFGAHGTLKKTYILHAEAEPPTRGGRSELIIHERDAGLPNPRGNRAFRVTIAPGSGENATLEVENIRFPLEVGASMKAAVRRFARGDLSCAAAPTTDGWDANQQAPGPEEPKKPNRTERRT